MHVHIDATTKILIAIFIALVVVAIYCYGNKPEVPTRVTLVEGILVG